MFTTPRKPSYRGPGRGSGRTPATSSQDTNTGLFVRGQWFCNCEVEPRLPAIRLQVKKNNKNKGRWFYACQQDRKKQCDFFLWEDAAQEREKQYLLNGGRQREEAEITTHIGPSSPPLPEGLGGSQSAPRSQSQRTQQSTQDRGFSLPTVSTGDEMDFMSAADRESQQRRYGIKEEQDEDDPVPGNHASRKRRREAVGGDSDEDEYGGGFGADEVGEMLALAESATQSQGLSQSQRSQMDDAQQQMRERQQFTTPTAQRTHNVLQGMPTPNTGGTVGRNRLLLATEERERDAKRQKLDVLSTPAHLRSGSSSSTARPSSVAQSSASAVDDYPITEEIMALLGGVPMLDDDVANTVRRRLNDFALRMKGVERGRDMVRTLVQGKDAKIAELQARVAQLEQQRTADRERIKTLASLVKDMS